MLRIRVASSFPSQGRAFTTPSPQIPPWLSFRDNSDLAFFPYHGAVTAVNSQPRTSVVVLERAWRGACLLYTSDAADDTPC
eukprot:1375597-Pyramimonas_sp.AAC.1